MSQDQPYLQVSMPSLEEERKLYEKWLKEQEDKEEPKEHEVIIIDMQ